MWDLTVGEGIVEPKLPVRAVAGPSSAAATSGSPGTAFGSDFRPSGSSGQVRQPKPEGRVGEEDLRFWPDPLDDDTVVETHRPMSAIVGFEERRDGSLQPVFEDRPEMEISMFVRRREQRYDSNLNARFPIRDPGHPTLVHPSFASADRTRSRSGITVERVVLTSSGTELLRTLLNHRTNFGVARSNVERAIAADLTATLAGERPPSEAHARVDTIRPDQVLPHERTLVGQRGLFAQGTGADAGTGIIGIFGGSYTEDTTRLDDRYGRDNVDTYSLSLKDGGREYVVCSYGGGNNMQYANAALHAPRSSTRPNIAYDRGRINASFLPAMVTFRDRDARTTFRMPVAAIVGHPGRIRRGEEIRLDYGDDYLARFREAYDNARGSRPQSPEPETKREPSEEAPDDARLESGSALRRHSPYAERTAAMQPHLSSLVHRDNLSSYPPRAPQSSRHPSATGQGSATPSRSGPSSTRVSERSAPPLQHWGAASPPEPPLLPYSFVPQPQPPQQQRQQFVSPPQQQGSSVPPPHFAPQLWFPSAQNRSAPQPQFAREQFAQQQQFAREQFAQQQQFAPQQQQGPHTVGDAEILRGASAYPYSLPPQLNRGQGQGPQGSPRSPRGGGGRGSQPGSKSLGR
jgi:hypothetical protein